MKSFGVGCFHFSIDASVDREISVKSYIEQIESTLKQLATISEISIAYSEDLDDETISVEARVGEASDRNRGPFDPVLPYFELEFKVYIPFRIQSELISCPEEHLGTGTETFKLYFKHDWYGPVSFVECVGAGLESQPSTAVQICREYLIRELKSAKSILKFDFLGPSPFHADYFLVGDEQSKNEYEGFACEHTKLPGYDKLVFLYAPHTASSEDEVFERLRAALSQELAFFYSLKTKAVGRMRNWEAINSVVLEILDYEAEDSKKSMLAKLFKKPRLFRKAFREIGVFKGQCMVDKSFLKREYSDIYASGKHDTHLKYQLDNEISSDLDYPIQETIELLTYFDNRDAKVTELMVVIFASLIGGIVGSLITLYGQQP
jgi:hypothetical protein